MIVLPNFRGVVSSSGPKDFMDASFIGPPLPSAIVLSGGWKGYAGDVIDGTYIRGPVNDWLLGEPFYYCPDINVLDGYQGTHPVVYFDNYLGNNGWYIFASDMSVVVYTNDNTKIPRTGWTSGTFSGTVGSYIGI